MGLRVIAPPEFEPITLAQAKADLRVDHSDDDDKITRYIAAARFWVERLTERKVALQTLEFVFDAFPVSEIKLPRAPVQEIVSVNYDNEAGGEQTVSPDDYWLDNADESRAWLFPETTWPATLDAVSTVRIQFKAGYATAADVPGSLAQAVRLKVQELYEATDNERPIMALVQSYLTLTA